MWYNAFTKRKGVVLVMAGKIKKISAVLMIGIISMTAVAGCSAPAAESEKESVAESAKMDTEALSPEETAGLRKPMSVSVNLRCRMWTEQSTPRQCLRTMSLQW